MYCFSSLKLWFNDRLCDFRAKLTVTHDQEILVPINTNKYYRIDAVKLRSLVPHWKIRVSSPQDSYA
jgi:hypothetical protein